jgi:predicted phage terminase large subunit-like protein
LRNCLLIDDPIKSRDDSDSEANSRRLKDWYTSVAYTRLQDDGAIIICQTRWSTDDLAGWVQKEHAHENWVVLNLPAINERGEALWPERFPLKVLNKIKKTLPARDWEALYQQKPFVESGDIYKKEWWRKWPEKRPMPECSFIIQSYDTAFSEKDKKSSSFSARIELGVFKQADDECESIILLGCWKDRVDYPTLRSEAVKAYHESKPDKVIIERKASGQSLIQDLRRASVPITGYVPDRDKISRAYMAQSLLENGRCYYPDRRWAEDCVDALARFPNSPDDMDVADAFSQAIIWLQSHLLVAHSADAERRRLEDEEDQDSEEDDDFLPSNVRRLRPKKRAAYA